MDTKIIRVSDIAKDKMAIENAAKLIKEGHLVAFPTETVYGLGADGLNPVAAGKIFAAKGRPADNPLILHISKMDELFNIAVDIPEIGLNLAEKFWPGPLTMIFKKSSKVPYITTGGLETVAVRMPDHPVALSLIKESGCPIAAPSANLSGRPSPTTANHVYADLKGRIAMVLDGGETSIGIESTVLDLTSDPLRILRPGGITLEDIKNIFPGIGIMAGNIHTQQDQKPKSPGMKYKHYSPDGKIILFEGKLDKVVELINHYKKMEEAKGINVGILATIQTYKYYRCDRLLILGDRENPLSISANLYNSLRTFDEMGAEVILIEGFEKSGIFEAVMDRLQRAASKIISANF